jgi:hypothetical protein
MRKSKNEYSGQEIVVGTYHLISGGGGVGRIMV